MGVLSSGRRALLAGFVLAVLLAGVAVESAHADQGTVDPDRLSRIPTRMQEFVDEGRLSGAVLVIARADTILLLEPVGYSNVTRGVPMRLEQLFRVFSIAKPVTAIGLMMLQDDGLLTTEDGVARHLPEFLQLRVAGGGRPSRPPLVRDLLTHTSGLDHEGALFDRPMHREPLAAVVSSYAQAPLAYAPGTRVLYSSPGIDAAGRIIEVVSGRPYEVFLEERLFVPLGMDDSSFFPSPEQRQRIPPFYYYRDGVLNETSRDLPHEGRRFSAPSRGLYSTASDMAALLQMLLNDGTYAGVRLLSEAAVAEMSLDQAEVEGMPPRGFGWALAESEPPLAMAGPLASDRVYGHSAAWGSLIWVDPERDLAAAFLTHQADPDQRHIRGVFSNMAIAAVTSGGGGR